MPFEPLQIVVGAVLGLAGAGALRFWQYGRDLWIANVNECCTAITESSRVATEYWTLQKLDLNSIVSPTDNQITEHKDQILNEAFMLGYQTKIDRSFDIVAGRISIGDAAVSSDLLDKFRDALTGGDYGSSKRAADHERARQSQVFASELVAEIRSSAQAALSLKGIITYLYEGVNRIFRHYLRP